VFCFCGKEYVDAAELGEHPTFGSTQSLQMLLRSSCLKKVRTEGFKMDVLPLFKRYSVNYKWAEAAGNL